MRVVRAGGTPFHSAAPEGDVIVSVAPQEPYQPYQPYVPFSVSVTPDRGEVAVVPRGELDLSSIDALEREVRELRDAGFEQIVVDLRHLTFMDSSGLRLLISLRNDAARNGHRLTLKPGSEAIQRVFAITGTRGLFDWRVGRTAAAPVRGGAQPAVRPLA